MKAMKTIQNDILWIFLHIKVAVFNFKILKKYKRVQLNHYKWFIRQYDGFELVGNRPYASTFYGYIEGLKVVIWLNNGILRIRRWNNAN